MTTLLRINDSSRASISIFHYAGGRDVRHGDIVSVKSPDQDLIAKVIRATTTAGRRNLQVCYINPAFNLQFPVFVRLRACTLLLRQADPYLESKLVDLFPKNSLIMIHRPGIDKLFAWVSNTTQQPAERPTFLPSSRLSYHALKRISAQTELWLNKKIEAFTFSRLGRFHFLRVGQLLTLADKNKLERICFSQKNWVIVQFSDSKRLSRELTEYLDRVTFRFPKNKLFLVYPKKLNAHPREYVGQRLNLFYNLACLKLPTFEFDHIQLEFFHNEPQ